MTRNTPALDIPIHVELPASAEVRARPSPLAFIPGALIDDKYRVERLLAIGGMGVVYECTDTLLDRVVALKVIHPDIAEDESIRARFLLEARTLARLTNPHITRVFECGYTASRQPYMVMELLEGTDLYTVLRKRGPLSAEHTARLALQVCRGLRDAHALGIVHRDLKPENLFLTHFRNGAELVKILDFGISKQGKLGGVRCLTNPSVNVGSPHYMPPEQVRSPSTVDGRADIWALGVVMYEALAGNPPFDAASLPELCRAVLSEPIPPLPASVPAEMVSIVQRCLQRDLALRYPSVVELARDLHALLEKKSQEPGRASAAATQLTPSTMERYITASSSSFSRSRGRKWLLSAALCLSAAGGTFGALRTGLLRLPESPPHPLLAPVWPAETLLLDPGASMTPAHPAAAELTPRAEVRAPSKVPPTASAPAASSSTTRPRPPPGAPATKPAPASAETPRHAAPSVQTTK